MSRRSAARRAPDRETAGAIDFDAALEAYIDGGDPEDLLRAASVVIGSTIPLDPERTEAIAELTGTCWELEDYDDAGRATRANHPHPTIVLAQLGKGRRWGQRLAAHRPTLR
jgi:hypothetical protein